ncbi:hypothetical protein T05_11290 [Trichinella murrelli]|uniref:Uncharacterized protein n=1 Tax=Trichinella murrelli TaxID=144512 RepID=A0A0V0SQ23_9BILA|nr:hypothetical protein T05_11290 [Trichinella murrelli]
MLEIISAVRPAIVMNFNSGRLHFVLIMQISIAS